MKRELKFIFRYIFFWLIVFLLNRIVFLVSATFFFKGEAFTHVLKSLVSGWLLDLSTTGYLLPVPGLLITLYAIFQRRWLISICNFFVGLFIVLYCLTCFGELFLYQEWTTKITMQALMHFQHPGEVFSTSPLGVTLLFFLFSIIFSAVYYFTYKKFVAIKPGQELKYSAAQKGWVATVSIIIFIPLNFLLIRGGWSAIPISDSDAYYSSNSALNDAAVNPLWSLLKNIYEYNVHQEENPYQFMDDAESIFGLKKIMHVEKDTTSHILSSNKPNIVFLILEGFTAYAVPNFGGDNYAPFLDSISRSGVAFTKCYSAAYTSDQGMPAILSAYPSTPKVSITNQSSKTKGLPCISTDLKTLGYESGFIFGGQLNYGNIKSYLYNTGFDVVVERNDLPESVPDGYLGIQDMDMVPLVLEKIDKAKQPFSYAWFTVSTHSPYDIPVPMKKITDGRENEYLNTIIYSDEALRSFFEGAKKKPWYSNTLFVVVSDHSHFSQRNFGLDDKEYHRIVAFFYGEVIKPEYRGLKIETITSQLDMTPTLLSQLHLPTDKYIFGKNKLNPHSPSFAYYDYHDGSGFITDSCFIARKMKGKNLVCNTCKDSVLTNDLRWKHEVFLQETFRDYLSR